MPRPTETQVARLLALPVEWRQRLAETAKDEPGWWVRETDPLQSFRVLSSPGGRAIVASNTRDGWAYAPCCALVWLRATGAGVGWDVDVNLNGTTLAFLRGRMDVNGRPIDAFLAYAKAHPCPETTSCRRN
jgi:hypothetical protein